MARQIRIEYAGAAYSVMACGHQGRDIYADDRDRIVEGRVLELGLKRGRKELAEEWQAVRRGWYAGGRELQAIGRLKRKGPPELERLKRRLEQVYENHPSVGSHY
jgi:hypothetical protein